MQSLFRAVTAIRDQGSPWLQILAALHHLEQGRREACCAAPSMIAHLQISRIAACVTSAHQMWCTPDGMK